MSGTACNRSVTAMITDARRALIQTIVVGLTFLIAEVGLQAQSNSNSKTSDPEFIPIPAGEFRRGFYSDDSEEHSFRLLHPYSNSQGFKLETPSHLCRISKSFELGRTEVTVGQFRTFIENSNYVTDAEENGGALVWTPEEKNYVDRFQKKPRTHWKNPGFPQTDQHPVVAVSWNDAVAYCEWRSKKEDAVYRLPSEAEWEYACRAGSTTWYSWGKEPDAAYDYANVADGSLEAAYPRTTMFQRAVRLEANEGDGTVFTAATASFRPNSWGLYDMHGNVWEWCQDRWAADRYDRILDGVPRKDRKSHVTSDPLFLEETDQHKFGDWRVIRGGAWTCAPASVRSSIRTFAAADEATVYTGFRVVRERE